ncbi:hypothetical protein SNEBB_011094 [Seison nebaliae]|nr:hypothetical protein SNEBB_011094 [Seison nebaliae]
MKTNRFYCCLIGLFIVLVVFLRYQRSASSGIGESCLYVTNLDLVSGLLPLENTVNQFRLRRLLGDPIRRGVDFSSIVSVTERAVALNKYLSKVYSHCYGRKEAVVSYNTFEQHGYTSYPLIHYEYSDERGWKYGRYDRDDTLSNAVFKKIKFQMKFDINSLPEDEKNAMFLDHGMLPIHYNLYISLTQALSSVLTKYGLTHVLYQGTLIGSLRHHDMIPWDDDVDIMVINDRPYHLVAALIELMQLGMIDVQPGRKVRFSGNQISSYYETTPWLYDKWSEIGALLDNTTKRTFLEEEKRLLDDGFLHIKYPQRTTKNFIYLYTQLKISFKPSILEPVLSLKYMRGFFIKNYFSYPTIDLWIGYPDDLNPDYYLVNFEGECSHSAGNPGRFHKNILHPIVHRPFGPLWLPTPNDPVLALVMCKSSQQIIDIFSTCFSPKNRHERKMFFLPITKPCSNFHSIFPFVNNSLELLRTPSTNSNCYKKLSMLQAKTKQLKRNNTFFSLEMMRDHLSKEKFNLLMENELGGIDLKNEDIKYSHNSSRPIEKYCNENLIYHNRSILDVRIKIG